MEDVIRRGMRERVVRPGSRSRTVPEFETEVVAAVGYAMVSWTLRLDGGERVKWFHEFGSEGNRGVLMSGRNAWDVRVEENIVECGA